jgi:hypothetical protein
MYNGQYIKAVIHVLVFVVLISITEHYGLFSIFLAAWVFYQVFDAHQTAKARRDGMPLPDPFGLNDLGNTLGGRTPPRPWSPPPPPPGTGPMPPAGTASGFVPGQAPGPVAGQSDWADQIRQNAQTFGQQAGQWGESLRQRIVADAHPGAQPYPPAGWAVPPVPPPTGAGYTPPPPPPGWVPQPPSAIPVPPPEWELERARREPIGAIVLILLGMLFLFNTLGFFNFGWVSHGWPLIIVGIAVWLLMRSRGGFHAPPPPGAWPPPPPPPPPTSEPPAGGTR